MAISEITKLEDTNDGLIILHEEGISLRAYEHSAFAFSTQIAEMQILKKAFKNLGGREVTYLGYLNHDRAFRLVKGEVLNHADSLKSVFNFDVSLQKAKIPTWYKHKYLTA